MDRAHLVGRDPQDFGDALGGGVRLLGGVPDGDLVALDLGQGAGRRQARVRLERPLVVGLDHLVRLGEGGGDVAGRLLHLPLGGRGLADEVVELGRRGEGRGGLRPGHLQRPGRLDRVPLALGRHADEVLVPHHPRALDVGDAGLVH